VALACRLEEPSTASKAVVRSCSGARLVILMLKVSA
jgi:hypothetical protein